MYQFDRHSYQKERFIQAFERDQRTKIEQQRKLEEERKIREQQDREYQAALMKDQLKEFETFKTSKITEPPETIDPPKPLTTEELRMARLAFFNKNLQSVNPVQSE